MSSLTLLKFLALSENRLSGSIPIGLLRLKRLDILVLHTNKLSGSIGGVPAILCSHFVVFENHLTGCLPPNLLAIEELAASGNMLEGTMPESINPDLLRLLAMSGQPGHIAALRGCLPIVMSRCVSLHVLVASWQALEGIIPPLAGTLEMLILQNNNFKIMSDARFEERGNGGSAFLIHNNLLSCDLPQCGNTSVKISLSGLGNHLFYPRKGFPAWVLSFRQWSAFLEQKHRGCGPAEKGHKCK